MGSTCTSHYKPKFDILKKQVELETLYDTLLNMHKQGTIHMNPNLKDLLPAEATTQHDFLKSSLLSKDLLQAPKSLKNHSDILVRHADKSNIFVALNKTDYANKLDTILHDTNKFTKINRNAINNLKIEIKKLISHINKQNTAKIFNPIIGELSPRLHLWNCKNPQRWQPPWTNHLSNPYSYIRIS